MDTMRPACLLIFTLHISCIVVFAQQNEYSPIPNNAKWVYTCNSYDLNFPFFPITDTIKYFSVGDTLIGDVQYMLIYSQINTNAGVQKRFYFRQDSIARRIYTLDLNSGIEFLLYDFNLLVGQTFNYLGSQNFITPLNGGQLNLCVDSELVVVSVQQNFIFNGNSYDLRTMSLGHETDYISWIEGVGSLNLLTVPYIGLSDVSNCSHCSLQSFCVNNTVTEPFSNVACPNLLTSISTQTPRNLNLLVHDNVLRIIDNDHFNIKRISVCDVYGRALRIEAYMSRNDYFVKILSSAEGILVVSIENNSGGMRTFRLFKQ